MGLLDTIATRLGYSKARPPDMPPLLQATGSGQQYTIPDYTVVENQAELFQRLSWVYGSVTAVARTALSAALNVKKIQGEKLKDIPNHDLELRLQRPNPLDSRSEFMVKTLAYRALTGNAYWYLNRTSETAPPPELWCIPPYQIEPIPDGRMFLKGYKYRPGLGEQDIILEPWQIVHFKEFHPRNWYVGLSPIEALATVASGDLKAQEWNTNFFGKDNGKPPGALAFSDFVADTPWEKLKKDIKDNWGGVNRSGPMLLRGVGQGGVNWVAMSLSQKDMEFLASRTFTKEEIYSIFAPGLASVLDVNATEANAKSGKATFIEMAVWPLLVSVAEKITNNLLPAYGDNLVAEFDDLRVTDRMLELQEQDKFATVHTVNEIRERYYEDKPLPDDDPRGLLLPAQIGPQTPGPPTDEGEETEPAPTRRIKEPQATADEAAAEPKPTMPELDTEAVRAEANATRELSAWRRYAVKRGAIKALEFGCEHLQSDVAEVVRKRLQAAITVEEVKAAFTGPFLKAAPRDDETVLKRKLARILAELLERLMVAMGDPPDFTNLAVFWTEYQAAVQAVMRPELERIADESATEMIQAQNIGIDWSLAFTEAAEWANTYTFELVGGITNATQRLLQLKVGQYFKEPGRTIGDLTNDLKPYFGEMRAEAIAVTEVTRASAEGQKIVARLAEQSGQKLEPIWHTNRDELVCDLCGPNDGKRKREGWTVDWPPGHCRCRCWLTHEWVR